MLDQARPEDGLSLGLETVPSVRIEPGRGSDWATHVRIADPAFVMPIIIGVIVWLGLFLREPRLRSLIPLRR